MPKASFASQDAYEPKLGFQEGYGRIINAVTRVFQYPPNRESGEQFDPFLASVWTIQKTDEQGKDTEDEPLEKVFSINKHLDKMRPGRATSRDDDDPEDLGDEIDTEGNVVFAEEGAKINKNTAFQVTMNSLEEAGFKAAILKAGYMPDLVGLVFHASAKKAEKRSINGRDVEPVNFIIDKILVRPYEQSTAAAGKKPAASAATRTPAAAAGKKANGVPAAPIEAAPAPAAAKANGATATPTATRADASGTPSQEADAAATGILLELASELQGSDPKDSKKFYAMAYSRLVRDKTRDKKLDKEVTELFKNDEWLLEKAAELEAFTFADGMIEFPAAA